MFFKTTSRINPQTGTLSIYYRLVENSRNALGGISQRNIMTVGYMDDVTTEELHLICDGLNDRIPGQGVILTNSAKVQGYIDHLYTRLVREKRIDRVLTERRQLASCDWDRVDLNSLDNSDVRQLGSEWLCLQTLYRLKVDSYLKSIGWSDRDVSLALAHIVCRAVYPASELKTVRYMQENPSICELLGLDARKITKDHLYRISHLLYAHRDGLQTHLSRKTNDLFQIEDKIYLYDLSNTYYEGVMRNSVLAQRGRSKEKRSDCPLIVLALVVNVEGFIKYSSIYEGNMADCNTLGAMIDRLSATIGKPSPATGKPIVVIDAGIATKENLKMITDKEYDYVCVSRSSLKKYTVSEGQIPITVFDNKNRPIELIQVQPGETGDLSDTQETSGCEYYLKVSSPAKSLKETSMYEQFCTRYEEGLALILKGIRNKGGVKQYDRVNQRTGRLAQKYQSVHRLYQIRIEKNEKQICTALTWTKKEEATSSKENTFGVYFLKTSIKGADEKPVWTVYNCLREIERSFRTLKTDLDLRPIYHKTDEASQSHLHLGLLAYWVVNTIRHQLKISGNTSDWREPVRVMNTQQCVTTSMINDKGQHISIRRCSKPDAKVASIYQRLKLSPAPFIRKKSVVPKCEPEKYANFDLLKDTG